MHTHFGTCVWVCAEYCKEMNFRGYIEYTLLVMYVSVLTEYWKEMNSGLIEDTHTILVYVCVSVQSIVRKKTLWEMRKHTILGMCVFVQSITRK